jgi:hypothetical protein
VLGLGPIAINWTLAMEVVASKVIPVALKVYVGKVLVWWVAITE